MRRYWVPATDVLEDEVLLRDEIFHHIVDVCRQGVGSKFEVLCEGQRCFFVEITGVEKKRAHAKILETRVLPPLPKPAIVLCLSIPRFAVFESILEKAVELGVSEIRPFFSDFSFVRTKAAWPEQKSGRFEKIIISATQQTGRGDLMPIRTPCHRTDLLKDFNQKPSTLGLFAYEGEAQISLNQHLKNAPVKESDEVWVFVGGEGGFSRDEVEEFTRAGLAPVTLGSQILRVETACIALISVLKYEAGSFSPF